MTNQEVLDLAYEYANCFTSGIVFSDENLVNFANAILAQASALPPAPQEGYRDRFTDAYIKMIQGTEY